MTLDSTPAASTRLTEREIREVLTRSLVVQLEVPDDTYFDADAPFTDLGLDSAGVVAVVGDLEDAVGFPVGPETLFDFPTIRSLTAHLAGASAPAC